MTGDPSNEDTVVLPVISGETATGAAPLDDAALLRTSRTMALGTIASRLTGFLRTAVIAAAVGAGLFGDAYNVANTAPNIIYELLLGGVLTSVVVPLLVRAGLRDSGEDDAATAYAQRLLTLVVVVLGGLTLLAVAVAPLIVRLYIHQGSTPRSAQEIHLATTFARYFLVQIVFYGVGATIGAILNVRGHFAAPMWTPVLNNLVVIATGVVFLVDVNGAPLPGRVGASAVAILGIGTTAGIIAQTLALLRPLRATGFHWRLRFDWRGSGLGEIRTVGKWVFVYVLANQLAYLVVVRLATAAAASAAPGLRTSYSSYFYAFMLFSLPHAIVTVSVITALLPGMSTHATTGRIDLLRADISRGLRLSASVLVPAAVALLVLGHEIAVVVFRHGNITTSAANYIGAVLIAFGAGLIPFSFFQLLLRASYALGDTRTPALVNIAVNSVNVLLDVMLFVVLPDHWRVVGLAAGYASSYAVGLTFMVVVLRRRLGGLDGHHVVRTLVRLSVAGVCGGAAAAIVAAAAHALVGDGTAGAWVGLVAGVGVGGTVFVGAALRMRVSEVSRLAAAVGLRRRPG